jgi:hypothetical protein
LSNLKTFRFEPGEIGAMEQALASGSLPENAIVHFCFALGKACEDGGDYARAFACFKRGNELRQMQEHYDPVNTDQIGERIRAVFTPELVARLQGAGHAGVAPIFVIGLPRSGSTLIEQILASHSAVEATSELLEGGRLVRFIDRQRVDGKAYPEAVAAFTDQALAELGRRYDRLLDYLHLADRHLAELWATLQSMDGYRGRTTLIVTTDHGRGRTPQDWAEHDTGIEGSQDIWIAILGPDTPAQGEVADQPGVTQSDIAATMLQYLGLDHRDFSPDGGPPIPGSLKPRE